MQHIDLNCDLGEGFPFDAELLPLISSANVACGGHAGDISIILTTLKTAAEHGVQVGAHPGFLDRENFGRRELSLPPEQIQSECETQIGLVKSLAERVGVQVRYVKPHGALYNLACRDDACARAVIAAAQKHALAVMALPGSRLETLAAGCCPFIAEGFADRRYQSDGSLVSRSQPDAFVKSPEEAVRQAQWLIGEGRVKTLCVHGDNPQAVDFVKALRQALTQAGFTIRPFEVT